jgi:hypothetical protein
MADLTAQRTLVKSSPELWSELSEVESLARHLGELGEIRIVRVEPESTVAWEGEEVSGTVELEQSGWGTKVTFRATVPEPDPATQAPRKVEPGAVAEGEPGPGAAAVLVEPEPVAVEPGPFPSPESVAIGAEPTAAHPAAEPERQGFLARWLFRRRQPAPERPAVRSAAAKPAPEPDRAEPDRAEPDRAEPDRAEPEPESLTEPEQARVDPKPDPPAEPEPLVAAADRVQQVLDGTLEALGQAHHRPFSRG